MLKPSIYDFHDPTEVMILKNFAYLNMKENTGNLTLQEYDILHGMVHQNALCLYYAKSPHMQDFFTDHRTMTLDMTAYTANLILWKYLISYKVEEAIDLLLDETFQTLTQPVNGIVPTKLETPYGNVILCKEDFTI